MVRSLISFVVLVVLVAAGPAGQKVVSKSTLNASAVRVNSFTTEEAKAVIREIFLQTRPDLLENSYFPEKPRILLQWFHNSAGNRLIDMEIALNRDEVAPGRMMMSGYRQRRPYLKIFAPVILELVKYRQGQTVQLDQKAKNTLVASLGHEILHWQNVLFYLKPRTPQEYLDEEIRAWRLTYQLIIRPLRHANQPLPGFFIRADDALGRCEDAADCPEFNNLIMSWYNQKSDLTE